MVEDREGLAADFERLALEEMQKAERRAEWEKKNAQLMSETAGRIASRLMLEGNDLKFKIAVEALRMIRDAMPPPGTSMPDSWCIGYMREWAASTITLLDEMERFENA
jgi:hypothetical protein